MNRIEEYLKKLIFRDVKFVLNSKIIKEGRIQMFNPKQNFIKFKINEDGEIKDWEICYPYDVKTIDNGFIFDYSLSSFCPRTEEIYWVMRALDKRDSSKFFDNHLQVLTS